MTCQQVSHNVNFRKSHLDQANVNMHKRLPSLWEFKVKFALRKTLLIHVLFHKKMGKSLICMQYSMDVCTFIPG